MTSHTTTDPPASLPHRAALARLEARIELPTSPQEAFRDLTGPKNLWWNSCQEALQAEPSWLLTTRAQDLRAFINDQSPGRPVADPAYVVARSLAARDSLGLHDLVEQWADSKLLLTRTPTGQGLYADGALATVGDDLRNRLNEFFHALVSAGDDHPAATRAIALTTLLLAGLSPRDRPVVRVPVVFAHAARSTVGVTGVLELREFPAGPEGLYPDPRTMADARSAGTEFSESLTHAWDVTPWPGTGRCVLWRLTLTDDPMGQPEIDGGSLGAAFALGMRELFDRPLSRRPSRSGLRGLFYGPRPRTAVTGVLSGGDRLQPVSGMDAKLRVTRQKRWRLVAPEPNRKDVHDAADLEVVRFAETLQQAHNYARQWRTNRIAVAAALALVLAAGGVILGQYVASNNRIQTAHQLATVSGTLVDTDVNLARLFAVEAYHQAPDAQTRAALFRALMASPHLVRSFPTDSPVTATAVRGSSLFAGTRSGAVQQWQLADPGRSVAPQRIMQFAGAVSAVATNAAGDVTAAIDLNTLRVRSATQGETTLRAPDGQRTTAVGVSPSGRLVAMATTDGVWKHPPQLMVLDRTTGHTTRTSLPPFNSPPERVVFPDDGHMTVFDGDGYGTWEHLSLPDLIRTAGGSAEFGVHNYASALSADGAYISYANGGSQLPLWKTEAPRTSTLPASRPRSMAPCPTRWRSAAPRTASPRRPTTPSTCRRPTRQRSRHHRSRSPLAVPSLPAPSHSSTTARTN